MNRRKLNRKISKLQYIDEENDRLLSDFEDEFDEENINNNNIGKSKNRKKNKNRNLDIDFSKINLIPQKINSSSVDIPISNLMQAEVIPAHPFSCLAVGMSGGGKTNTIVYMLNNFYKNYYDQIIVLGNTARTDGMYEHLYDLHDDDIYTDDLEGECKRLLNEIKDECENEGVTNCPRRCIILEDATSEKKLIYSKSFIKLFVQARHLNVSIICSIHKLRAIDRAARINATCIFMFSPVKSDYNIFIEEYCPPSYDKNDFKQMLNYAFKKTEDMPKPFLYYNRSYDDLKNQFRRGFHEILNME